MKNSEKVFNVVVTVVVMLTGAGFGAFTGAVYSDGKLWWIGLIAGVATAFPLAKFYLWQLAKSFAKNNSRIRTWLWGTFIAILCGVICTTITHGVMAMINYPNDPFSSEEVPGIWPIVIIVGEIIGAGAGLIVGGICSLVYVLGIKGEQRESTSEEQS